MVKKKTGFVMSNRLLYTLITIGILAAVGVGVYAVVPGTTPNPGHDVQSISPPSGCQVGQYLRYGVNINGGLYSEDWMCGTITPGVSGSGTENYLAKWTGSGALGNSVIFQSGSNIGIGTSNPTSSLVVNGSAYANKFVGDGSGLTNLVVRVSGADPICDSTKDGLLKYKSSFCSSNLGYRSSTFDICMRTGDTTYAWYNLKTYTWADSSCNIYGCPTGEQYYQCTNPSGPAPGCYASEPPSCYCTGTEQPPCPY